MAAYRAPYDYLYKFLMVGSIGAGKSCLKNRFCKGTFEASCSTVGVDFALKTFNMNGETIKAQVWDTTGQERFGTITHAYYRGAAGVLLCFDLSSEKHDVAKWNKDIQKHAKGIPVILVGCKSDLERKISVEEIATMSRELGFAYVETSSKNNSGVEEAFTKLTEEKISRRAAEKAQKAAEEAAKKAAKAKEEEVKKKAIADGSFPADRTHLVPALKAWRSLYEGVDGKIPADVAKHFMDVPGELTMEAWVGFFVDMNWNSDKDEVDGRIAAVSGMLGLDTDV